MNTLFDKLLFGKSKAEVAEQQRRKLEETEEVDLRKFVSQLPNANVVHEAYRSALVSSDATSSMQLEEVLLPTAQRGVHRGWPVKLIRLLIARFSGHLSEPAVRLPKALELLHAALSLGTSVTKQFVEEGACVNIVKAIEVAVEELELRLQREARDSVTLPVTSSSTSSEACAERPLYSVLRFGLMCVTLISDVRSEDGAPKSPYKSSVQAGAGGSQAASGGNSLTTFWKSKSSQDSTSRQNCLWDDGKASSSIRRLFSLVCRCTLPSRCADDSASIMSILQSTATLVSHIASKEGMVVRELVEGTVVVLVRLHGALTDTASLNEGDEAESEQKEKLAAASSADPLLVLFSFGGKVLRALASAMEQWPLECVQSIDSEGLFQDHYAAALRSSIHCQLLAEELSASEEQTAMDGLERFAHDTHSGLHSRDITDSLQAVFSRLFSPGKQRPEVQEWLFGVEALQNAIRAATDAIRRIAYKKSAPSSIVDACLICVGKLESALVSSFTSSATTGSFARRYDLTTKNGTASVLHRWFLGYLVTLMPLNPLQVRPLERSRAAALHRLVANVGLLQYFFGDPLSGWCSNSFFVHKFAMVVIVARYILLNEENVSPASPAVGNNKGRGAAPAGTSTSSATFSSPPMNTIRTLLEALEHFSQLLHTRPRQDVVCAVWPLCALLRWALIAKEQTVLELIIDSNATSVLTSCASALARTVVLAESESAATTNVLLRDSMSSSSGGCKGLDAVLDTLQFVLRYRPILQFQLRHEPAAVIQLMVYPSSRVRASQLLQQLLCYDSDGEAESVYHDRMMNLVTDLWDITTNSREVPDEVYLALLACVRDSLDACGESNPFAQTKLQNVLCSSTYATDCYVRLVHPLSAGFHKLDVAVGRSAVLATVTSLVRANPSQREQLLATVGEAPLVKSAMLSCCSHLTPVVVKEMLGILFEEQWVLGSNGSTLEPQQRNASVQNERILQGLLIQFQTDLDSSTLSEVERQTVMDALMLLVERLKIAFANCRASVWACASHSGFEHLVALLSHVQLPQHITAMEQCLSLLTARHIDIRQLKRLVGVISHAPGVESRRKLVPSVIEILHAACHTHLNSRGEPKNYIAMRSRSGPAGVSIAVPNFPKNGYSISLWVRWEGGLAGGNNKGGFHDVIATLLSLADERDQTAMRIDLTVSGTMVIRANHAATPPATATSSQQQPAQDPSGLHVVSSTGIAVGPASSQTHPLMAMASITAASVGEATTPIPLHQWTHVVITHKTSLFGADLTVFTNGKELRTVRIAYPIIPSSGLLTVVIGSTMEALQLRQWSPPLHGQVNAVYVLSKVLTPLDVHQLHLLGANHATCFLPQERALVNPRCTGLYDSNLNEKVVVCIDPRLSEKGKLFNAASVSKISITASSTPSIFGANAPVVSVTLHEGAFTCHTSSIIDTTCSLGALQSLILPLLVMQVNANLPISSKGLTVDVQSLLPEDGTALRDTLKLLDSLIIVDVVRAEALALGTFPILALVLEKLGSRVGPEIPQRLAKLCCSISEHSSEVFQGSFQALFQSFSMFQACSFETRRAFVGSLHVMCKNPLVLASIREFGVVHHLVHLVVKCCNSSSAEDVVIRDLIFALMDITIGEPIQKADAESLVALVSSVAQMTDAKVAEHIMESSRWLVVSKPRELCGFLGRLDFAGVLCPLLKHDSCIVRCEATRQLGILVSRSKATQLLFRYASNEDIPSAIAAAVALTSPTTMLSKDKTIPPEELSLTNVADVLRHHPVTPFVYTHLRCLLTCSNAKVPVDTTVVPALLDTDRLMFSTAMVPLLMLCKEAPRDIRIQALSDLHVLVCADTQSWHTILRIESWFITITDVMLSDDVDPGEQVFGRYREAPAATGAAVTSTDSRASVNIEGRESLLEIGIRLLSTLMAQAICSPSHTGDDLDQLVTYIHNIRHDERTKCLLHAIHHQVLDECVMRNGGAYSGTAQASAVSAHMAKALFGTTSTASTNNNNASASPHRQAILCSNPKVERNLQQFFFSLEDQCFYGYDIATAIHNTQRGDGFVHVDADEEPTYREERSHVYLPSPVKANDDATSTNERIADNIHGSSVDAAVAVAPSTSWLHADIALKALHFIGGCVSLVNNCQPSPQFSLESQCRKGGIQRIFLRLLRASTTIAALDNDYMELVLQAVKSFQSLVDKTAASGIFGTRKSTTEALDDASTRSSLSLVLILHRLILNRKTVRGGAGGRNRFINQRVIERLKVGIRDTLQTLKDLGAFQKQTAAHLDSTHRCAVKTLAWLENPLSVDVDEFFEISLRDDYRRMIVIIEDAVGKYEDQLHNRIRDMVVRYHSNCVAQTQQALKQLVLSRQLMMEKLDAYASSEETRQRIAATLEVVVGDANAAKIALSLLAANWGRFVARLRGTIWDADPSEKLTKYVRQNRAEQRPLLRYKLVKDKEGTDHHEITDKHLSPFDDESSRSGVSKSAIRLKRLQFAGIADDNEGGDGANGEDTAGEGADGVDGAGFSITDMDSLESSPAAAPAPLDKQLKVRCEYSYLMHCWSCTAIVTESTLTVLLDDENVAYNQIVAKDATQYLIRPRNMTTWLLGDVIQIAPAKRFRMRRVAIELYFRDHTSLLLNFADAATMHSVTLALKRGATIARMKADDASLHYEAVEMLLENPRKELAKQRLTEMWKQRELSNFDYLLALNSLASRTVNDLTQYPVFPWIIADYESETLDLNDPSTFRDLSLPVGLCGGSGRREEIEMRFDEMTQMGDIPFHYFTHYSSPAVVLYFLVRVEPFTTCQVLLQGGRFDHADRMFHSVAASWCGVTKNIQDVKELIPECYFLPELYINNNNVRFGMKQDRKEMSHAVLPAWANNDPYTLVYRLREALECDHVSSELHHWIDLIFGYKQRGKHAVEALNLFHPHTYEVEKAVAAPSGAGGAGGEVSKEERSIVIDSLDNIGQTPIQLFTKKHPERKPNMIVNPILEPAAFGYRGVSLAPQQMDSIAVIRVLPNERLVVIGSNGAALVFRWNLTPVIIRKEATPSKYRLEGMMKKIGDLRAANISFDVDSSPENRVPPLPLGCMPSVCEALAPSQTKRRSQLSTAIHSRSSSVLPSSPSSTLQSISNGAKYAPCSWRNTAVIQIGDAICSVHGGFFDNSCVIRALNVACDELRFSSHRDRVICLAASEDSKYLVTGGRDTTFIVWALSFRNRLHASLMFSICGHEDEPSAVAVNHFLDVVATASCDGQWMMHSLSTGKLEQCLTHPSGYSVDFLLLQHDCYVPNVLIASCTDYTVHQYSLNAAPLRSVPLPGRLIQWCPAGDSVHVALLMTPPNVLSTDLSSIVYFHSFFLTQTCRIAPNLDESKNAAASFDKSINNNSSSTSVGGGQASWMTCIDGHRATPQLMVAGAAHGDMILVRTEAIRQSF